MVNRHRDNWSAMGSSLFEFENDIDERFQAREQIYSEFKERLITDYRNVLKEFAAKSNLVKLDNLMKDGIRILMKEFMDY